ncbi:MAG: glycosyltransferase family 2 protein [Actinomycetota bacterium]|nr:glycosyltransferase family 2 protein [Actinomycetota bacterium]
MSHASPAPPAGAPRVAAVVVNHDAGDALLDCVASLRAAGVEQVVVVDNSSSDGSLERLAAADRAALVVPTGRNLGYGRAVNLGSRRVGCEYLLVCNPDVVVGETAVRSLVAAMDAAPGAGVAGPLLRNPDGSRYPSARAFPSLAVGAGHALLGKLAPDNRWSRAYRMADRFGQVGDGSPGDERVTVDWVSGACFLARRVAFDALGGFDERYFMYAEDLDLCWRLGRAGWDVCYVPGAEVLHLQGLTTAARPVRMAVAHHVSTWRFARVSARGPARAALPLTAAALVVRLGATLGAHLARAVLTGRAPRGGGALRR